MEPSEYSVWEVGGLADIGADCRGQEGFLLYANTVFRLRLLTLSMEGKLPLYRNHPKNGSWTRPNGALLKAKVTRSKCEPFLFRMQRMTTSPAPASPHEDRRPVGQLGGLLVRRGLGRVSSQKLLGTLRELEIEHGTERYRLRVTSTGKLILTK